jgi:hypothetical protein
MRLATVVLPEPVPPEIPMIRLTKNSFSLQFRVQALALRLLVGCPLKLGSVKAVL